AIRQRQGQRLPPLVQLVSPLPGVSMCQQGKRTLATEDELFPRRRLLRIEESLRRRFARDALNLCSGTTIKICISDKFPLADECVRREGDLGRLVVRPTGIVNGQACDD